MEWITRKGIVDLIRPKIMGIWNVSPDSFSSCCDTAAASIAHAEALIKNGAGILDIGAESTRPGAEPVSFKEEISRLEKPLQWVRENVKIPVSLDSYHPETIAWALDNHYVDIINDIAMTEHPTESREGVVYRKIRDHHAGLVCMAWMPHDASPDDYETCLKKIISQLEERVEFAVAHGMDKRYIVIDPGVGFGKGLDNDLRLISESPHALGCIGCPVLIAHSRKRCLSKATGLSLEQLDDFTATMAVRAIHDGAKIIRMHNPAALSAMIEKMS